MAEVELAFVDAVTNCVMCKCVAGIKLRISVYLYKNHIVSQFVLYPVEVGKDLQMITFCFYLHNVLTFFWN